MAARAVVGPVTANPSTKGGAVATVASDTP